MRGGSDSSSDAAAKTRKLATPQGNSNSETKLAPGAPPKRASAPKMSRKDDRRGHVRVRSRSFANGGITASSTRTASSFLATTVNISIGGCLIRTYEALDPGMDVTINVKLPEGELCTAAKVIHVNEDAVGCRMCGVRFAPLLADSHTLLLQHISVFGVEAPTTGGVAAGRPVADGSSNGKFVVEGRINRS